MRCVMRYASISLGTSNEMMPGLSRETKRETNENDRPIDRSPWRIPQLKKTDTSPVERELVGFTTKF